MSQVTVTTTTPPVTVVSRASITAVTITMAPTSMALAAVLGQHGVVIR